MPNSNTSPNPSKGQIITKGFGSKESLTPAQIKAASDRQDMAYASYLRAQMGCVFTY